MAYMICSDIAPPAIQSILFEWHTGENDIEEFICRTIERADAEGFKLEANHNGSYLLYTLILSTLYSEQLREEHLRTGVIEKEFGVNEDFVNWDGLCISLLFASDELLRRLVSAVPPDVLTKILQLLSEEEQMMARAKLMS